MADLQLVTCWDELGLAAPTGCPCPVDSSGTARAENHKMCRHHQEGVGGEHFHSDVM